MNNIIKNKDGYMAFFTPWLKKLPRNDKIYISGFILVSVVYIFGGGAFVGRFVDILMMVGAITVAHDVIMWLLIEGDAEKSAWWNETAEGVDNSEKPSESKPSE